jgi:hypothetical protein
MRAALGVLATVFATGVCTSECVLGQGAERCPEDEWSPWYQVVEGLHISFRTCMRGSNQEIEWSWSNVSNSVVSLAYRVFSRGADKCRAPAEEAIGAGHLTVHPGTRVDYPGASVGPGRYGDVQLCISRDWQTALQDALQSLDRGMRVRISATSMPNILLTGSVASVAPNAVRIRVTPAATEPADSLRLVRFDEVSGLAISGGIKNKSVFGLVAGGLLGVLGGGNVGYATAGYECEWVRVFDEQTNRPALSRVCTGQLPGKRAAIVGLVSGVAGGVLGYLIGSRFQSERWVEVGPTWTLVRF